MKSLLLVAFLATPATFCMNAKNAKEVESPEDIAIASRLKKELGTLPSGGAPRNQRVDLASMSGAIQKAFGHHGPEHVATGCIDTLIQCYAPDISDDAQIYVRGFLDALTVQNPSSLKEHARIVAYVLRGRFQHLKLQQDPFRSKL